MYHLSLNINIIFETGNVRRLRVPPSHLEGQTLQLALPRGRTFLLAAGHGLKRVRVSARV